MKVQLFAPILILVVLIGCSSPSSPPTVPPTPPPVPALGNDLLINEVVYPVYVDTSVGVELFNPTSRTINLGDYALRSRSFYSDDGWTTWSPGGVRSFPLPALAIPPGGYAVVRGDAYPGDYEAGGNNVYTSVTSDHRYTPYIAPSGDFVELTRIGTTMDFVRWGSSIDTPSSPDFAYTNSAPAITSGVSQLGYSWARNSSSADTRDGGDWVVRAWNTLGGVNDVTSDLDADSDGIPDSSEVSGSTFAGLPLYTWGARVGQKDIFINVDYMVNGSVGATDEGIIPRKAALDKVVAAFAAKNYFVHFDVGTLFGSGLANHNLDGRSHAVAYVKSATLGKVAGYANAYQYRNRYLPSAKSKVFFYMLFGNSQLASGAGGSSGVASLPGNTALISLGGWGLNTSTSAQINYLENYQAATVMHEFGHNLGLQHGGGPTANYKPNYLSVMNYLYQLNGLPTIGVNDGSRYYKQLSYNHTWYSRPALNAAWTALADSSSWTDGAQTSAFRFTYSDLGGGSASVINEAAANETAGLAGVRAGAMAVDFDNSGTASGTSAANIRYLLDTGWATPDTPTTLSDFDDWGAINSVFQRHYNSTYNGVSLQASEAEVTLPLRKLFAESSPTESEPCATDPRLFRP